MMSITAVVRSLLNIQKKIDVSILPSQGLFYKDDFEIKIKKTDIESIKRYENDYKVDDISIIILKLKEIVKLNTTFSDGYYFEDIKSIDIVFLFLEIVKYTKNTPVLVTYFNDISDKEEVIEFTHDNFNYYKIDSSVMKCYDKDGKRFKIDGYSFTLPSIGIENSLTRFLLSKISGDDSSKYSDYYYDFTFFLGDKNFLKNREIENLIQIFNFDMEESEILKVNNIVRTFLPIQRYSLIKDDQVIEINSKIDLENIWK